MYKLLLANRYLRTRFIALASVISVTLGVATMIVVNSVMTGFATEMRDRIHGILADMVVESNSMDGAADAGRLVDRIQEAAGQYIESLTPTVEVYGMMNYQFAGQNVNRPVTIIGIVPETKEQVSPMSNYLVSRQSAREDDVVHPPERDPASPLDWSLTARAMEDREAFVHYNRVREMYARSLGQQTPEVQQLAGESAGASDVTVAAGTAQQADPFAAAPASIPEVDPKLPLSARLFVAANVISYPYLDEVTGKMAIQHMARPGQDVILTTIKTGQPQPVGFKATIVDVFKSGMSEYDSNLVFCNLEELQYVRGMLTGSDPTRPHDNLDWRNGAITSVQIKLKNFDDAPEVTKRLRSQLGFDFQIRTWEEKQGPLLQAVAVESAILNVLLFLIITVAGFGILAIFYMIVIEKTRDIGILKALGASSRGVMLIFLSYGLSLGVVGSGGGVVLGLLFIRYINQIEEALSWLTGRKVFDEAIYYFHEIPTVVQPSMVIYVALGAMLIAVLASVLPARRAAALHPVCALRYE